MTLVELRERLGLRRTSVPLVLQAETSECALACLAMIATHLGHRIDLGTLRRRYPPSVRGTTLRDLMSMAAALQLSARPLKVDLKALDRLRTPSIVHWNLDHFVVLVGVRGDRVTIHDPALGRRVYPMREVSKHFTGVALELAPGASFERKSEERRLFLRDLWSRIRGLRQSLATILLLSLLIQVATIIAPFYVQLVVDDVVSAGDENLVTVLALGFGLLLVVRVGISLLRGAALLHLGSLLNFQISSNLIGHLLRLPLAYFEKRHLGDVVSRFRSLAPIEELFAKGFVSVVIDGLMVVCTLLMMFLFSWKLAAVTLAAAVVFGLVRIWLYAPIRRIREEAIVAAAKEDTVLIEAIRGIPAIKILGAESQRESLWQNRRADALNANVRVSRWELAFTAANGLIFGAENLIVVALGAGLVLGGSLTVGMLYAYLMYKSEFSERVNELIDWGIRYRMLDVHLLRLADIVHSTEEPGLRASAVAARPLEGRIELRGVSYRYSETDPYVLRDASLAIEEGSCVAIIGRSGSGKSTLLKLILGLLHPTEGEIVLNGRTLRQDRLVAYRSQIGAVMQDDCLFDGTISENISAFDPYLDRERIEDAARAACIHDDIAAMPMSYQSLVGNMGNTLSGGQVQRLLLARAFYRRPRLLVLDEGTANLDPGLLDAVWASIRALKITCIVATHQHVLLAHVTQVVVVENGSVCAAQPPPGVARKVSPLAVHAL